MPQVIASRGNTVRIESTNYLPEESTTFGRIAERVKISIQVDQAGDVQKIHPDTDFIFKDGVDC